MPQARGIKIVLKGHNPHPVTTKTSNKMLPSPRKERKPPIIFMFKHTSWYL